MSEKLAIRGFVRGALQDPDGTVHMGEWHENVICNVGFAQYILGNVGRTAQSTTYPSHMAIASGSSAYATDTTGLASELAGARGAITATVVSSKTLQMVASWASNVLSPSESVPIAAVGIFYNSSISTGSAGSLVSFTQSTCSSTQTFAITYNWIFA
jgi:hypothetical protein